MNAPRPILMLGSHLSDRGGIVSVEQVILSQPLPEMPIRFLPTVREKRHIRTLFLSLRALFEIIVFARRYRAVFMHMSYRGSALRKAVLVLCARLRGLSPVILAHGSSFQDFWQRLPAPLHMFLRASLRRSAFLTLSPRWQKYYRQILAQARDRVLVLENAVPIPEHTVEQIAPAVHLVFLGRIGERKGSFDLIQALSMLPADLPAWRMSIAGDGEIERARGMVEKYGLEQQVELPGWVDAPARDALLRTAQILVLPSYHEGLPMAVLEAMANGLAVITTPVGGIPDAITSGENGLLVQPGDHAALADAMASLIRDEHLRQRLATAGRQRVSAWDAADYPHRLAARFDALLPKTRS